MLRLVVLLLTLLPALTQAFEPGDAVVCTHSRNIQNGDKSIGVLLPGSECTVRRQLGSLVQIDVDGWVPADCLIAAKEAADHFRQRVKRNPKDIEARCGLAMVLSPEDKDAALKEINEAVRREESWITLERKARLLLSSGATDEGLAALERALQLEPRSVELRLLRGPLLLKREETELAIKDFDYVLERRPHSAQALQWRSSAWLLLEDWKRALADLNVVLEHDPKNINALLSRGTLLAAGRPDDALRDANAALAIDQQCAEAYRLRGWVYLVKGEAMPAITALNRAIELKPDDSNFLTTRAACWIGRKEPDKAIDDYTAAIKVSPQDAQHWGNRSYAWWMKKDLPKALADLNEAIRLEPTSSTWIANRGAAYMEMGDYPAAIAGLKQALDINPKETRARFRLAWIYACIPDDEVRSGETALKLLVPILESEKDEDEFGRLAAEAFAAAMAENGDFKLAVKSQHAAISLAETEEETREARERLTLYEAGKPYRLPAKRR